MPPAPEPAQSDPPLLSQDEFLAVRKRAVETAPPGMTPEQFTRYRDGLISDAERGKRHRPLAAGAEHLTGPRTWGESTRENLPAIGGTIGGLTGAALGAASGPGAPATSPTLATAGAGVGQAGGEALRIALRRRAGLPTPQGLEAAESIAGEGVIGAATEWVGGALFAPVRRFLGGWYHELMQGAEAKAARAASEKWGLPVTAQELAGKPDAFSLKLAHSGYFKTGQATTREAQTEAREKIVQAIGTSLKKFDQTLLTPPGGGTIHPRDVAGGLSQGGWLLSHQLWQTEDHQLYRAVDQAIRATTQMVPVTRQVPSSILGPNGQPIMRTVTTLVPETLQVNLKPLKLYVGRQVASLRQIIPTLSHLAGQDKSLLTLTDAIGKLPDSANFENANLVRSSLLSEIRKISSLLPGKYKGLEKKVASLLDAQMEATAQRGGATVVSAWRHANQWHAAGAKIFEKPSLVAAAVKGGMEPENVFRLLRPDQVTEARELMAGFTTYEHLGNPQEKVALNKAREVFRQGYLGRMLEDSILDLKRGGAGDLKGALDKYRPVLDVLLADPKGVAVRRDLTELAAFLDRQATISGLSHWALFEAMAGASVIAVGQAAETPAILAGAEGVPYALSKILYSRPAKALLMDGIVRLPPVADRLGPLLLRAARIAVESGYGESTPPGTTGRGASPPTPARPPGAPTGGRGGVP
jgi:hypothetical protein